MSGFRQRQEVSGRHRQRLPGGVYRTHPSAAARGAAFPSPKKHPGPEPLHRHRPHAHGHHCGYFQEIGASPVSGYTQRVRTTTLTSC